MSDLVNAALINAGTSLGLGALGSSGSKTQGQWNRRLIRSENEKARQHTIDMVTMGNEMDIANQKEIYDYKIQQGIDAGLTPYEAFLGPAAGSSGGTTGSANVLGNQPVEAAKNAVAGANAQLAADTQTRNAMIQAGTQVQTAKIQADAQKEVAGMQTGATIQSAETSAAAAMYNSDVQREIAANRLSLDEKRFNQIDVPQAAINLQISEQQLKKSINEAATSDPKYQTYMKKLTMGLDNQISEYVQGAYRFDVTKPETFPKTKEERRELLGFLLAVKSGTLSNVEGLKELVTQGQNAIMETVKGYFGAGMSPNLLGGTPWSQQKTLPPEKQRRPGNYR